MIEVRRVQSSDQAMVARVFGEAFRGYPMMEFFFGAEAADPRHPDFVKRMFSLVAHARAEQGSRDVVGILNGSTVGATLTDWPDSPEWTAEQEARWDEFVSGLPEFSAKRFEAYWELKNDLKPKHPHVYLGGLGVVPEAQGKGVGTALLDAISQAAAPMPVCLDTQTEINARYYQRHGYVALAETELQGIPFWMMERPAP